VNLIFIWRLLVGARKIGHAVAQLVEALRYKPGGCGFDPRNISLTSFQPHYDTGVDSACNRNDYQEYFLEGKGGQCLGLTSPPSCADCLEIWEPQPPEILRACTGLLQGLLYFFEC